MNANKGDAASLIADLRFEAAGMGSFRLRSGSPCIDAGDTATVPESAQSDHAGGSRILDGDGDATVDIGAFELPEI